MEENNIPLHFRKDTYTITKRLTPEGKTYCAVCSRLRRVLYMALHKRLVPLKLL